MAERRAPIDRESLLWLGGVALAGALGGAGGAAGALDPVAWLAWLALLAPAGGALCARGGRTSLAWALLVPVAWTALLRSCAHEVRDLSVLPWAACAVAGLFALGLALGRRAASPPLAAGALLALTLTLASAALGFGLLADGAALARTHPGAARALLDVNPLVLVFDCAGWDWTHAQPEVYAGAGVEWFQRRPWSGNLAGPAVLVVGCSLAWLARSRSVAARAT